MITAILQRTDSSRRTLYLAISDENVQRLREGDPIRVPGERLASLGIGHGEVEVVIELLGEAEFTELLEKARADGAVQHRQGRPVS